MKKLTAAQIKSLHRYAAGETYFGTTRQARILTEAGLIEYRKDIGFGYRLTAAGRATLATRGA